MRLNELLDRPVDFTLTNTTTDPESGYVEYEHSFVIQDRLYKVYNDVIQFSTFPNLVYWHGDPEQWTSKLQAEVAKYSDPDHHVLTVDFGVQEYIGKSPGGRLGNPPTPMGDGEERYDLTGKGNELEVFSTVVEITKKVWADHKATVGAIDYGVDKSEIKRKKLYSRLMKYNGITGPEFHYEIENDADSIAERTMVFLQ